MYSIFQVESTRLVVGSDEQSVRVRVSERWNYPSYHLLRINKHIVCVDHCPVNSPAMPGTRGHHIQTVMYVAKSPDLKPETLSLSQMVEQFVCTENTTQ